MSFIDAIVAFKGAVLGALLGNHSPHNEFGATRPYRPHYGNSGHHYHQPHFGHTQPGKPCDRPYFHQQPVGGYQPHNRPLYPLFR